MAVQGSNPYEGAVADCYDWWMKTAAADFAQMAPKIESYGGSIHGSADLEVMGNALATLLSERGIVDADELSDPVSQEIATWLYALGKISRLISDYRAGRPGNADSWHDLTVYALMARRIQAVGAWPG